MNRWVAKVARSLLLFSFFWGGLSSAVTLGCDNEESDGTKPQNSELPPLKLTDQTSDLLVTWLDDKGNGHTTTSLSEVPAEARNMVNVVIADKLEGHTSLLYVADLTRKQADGSYPVRTMRRVAWEAEMRKRRAAYVAKHAPPPVPQPTATSSGKPTHGIGSTVAIIYGAPWCGPCHVAARYLKQRGVRVIEKNIDGDAKARAEMQQKLKRIGRSGSTIPVIDINGVILVGFSQGAIDRALRQAQSTTPI